MGGLFIRLDEVIKRAQAIVAVANCQGNGGFWTMAAVDISKE
jgi:hypothetical protein